MDDRVELHWTPELRDSLQAMRVVTGTRLPFFFVVLVLVGIVELALHQFWLGVLALALGPVFVLLQLLTAVLVFRKNSRDGAAVDAVVDEHGVRLARAGVASEYAWPMFAEWREASRGFVLRTGGSRALSVVPAAPLGRRAPRVAGSSCPPELSRHAGRGLDDHHLRRRRPARHPRRLHHLVAGAGLLHRHPLLAGAQRATLDESGLRFNVAGTETSTDWTTYGGFQERRRTFILRHGKSVLTPVTVLAKRGVVAPHTVDEVRAMLEHRLSTRERRGVGPLVKERAMRHPAHACLPVLALLALLLGALGVAAAPSAHPAAAAPTPLAPTPLDAGCA